MSTSTYYNFITPRGGSAAGNSNTSNTSNLSKMPNGIPTATARTTTASASPQARANVVSGETGDHLTQQQQRHSPTPIASSMAATSASSTSSSTSLNQFNSLASITSNASSASSCSSSVNNSISSTTCCPASYAANVNPVAASRVSGLPRPTTMMASLSHHTNYHHHQPAPAHHGSPLMVSIGENDMTTCTATIANLSSGCSSGSSSSGGSCNGASHGRRSLGSSTQMQTISNYNLSQQQYSPSSPASQMFHSQTLHSLEPKSYKPFKSSSEYVEAMKEDLAEWLNKLYSDLDLTPENFFSQLETGAIICRHANNVTQMGRNFLLEQKQQQQQSQNQSVALNDCKDSINNEQNNNSINGISLCSSSQSPTNSSDSDKGISMASMSSLNSNGMQNNQSKQENDNSLVATVAKTTNVADGHNHNEEIGKLFRSKYQHSSYDIQRRASSPNNFLSISPTPLLTTSKSIDKHNINWFRVKMIPFKQDACPGTFFARDNICQFILWCRSLHILDCLLFETDDLVARKNVRSFILCLLEVARIGFKVGMPTPLIIQLEHEIDREIENDAKLEREKQNQAADSSSDCDSNFNFDAMRQATNEHQQVVNTNELVVADEKEKTNPPKSPSGDLNVDKANEERNDDDGDNNTHSEVEEEVEEDIGPKPQVITNDLVSLHEKVVQLLCQCTCPTQFPMVRIGDGKYKVGDKLIIFVRILRRHIMVRVGGGWQELSEFLRQKDPCRSRPIQASSIQQLHNTTFPIGHQNHHHNHPSGKSTVATTHSSATKLRLLGSSHQLNKGHHNTNNGTGANSGNSYRNSNGQRLISSSVSMSWLSSNGNP